MLKEIFSKDNQIIKSVRALQSRSGRKKHGLYFVEGNRITDEAVNCVSSKIQFIIMNNTFKNEYLEKVNEYSDKFDCYVIPDTLFKEISDTETPQGILAVIKNTPTSISNFSFNDNNIIILDSVRDPGNIGTIIRTAEAMGFNSIFLSKGCTDIYSPKILRSTMGSLFRTNIYENITLEDINSLKEKSYKIISTALQDNSVFLEDATHFEKTAIVIGNEADGVSKGILEISDLIIKIPMKGKTESLNAAIAAAIVMYHFSID